MTDRLLRRCKACSEGWTWERLSPKKARPILRCFSIFEDSFNNTEQEVVHIIYNIWDLSSRHIYGRFLWSKPRFAPCCCANLLGNTIESTNVPCTVTCAPNDHGTMVSRPKPRPTGLHFRRNDTSTWKVSIYHPSGQLGAFYLCGIMEPHETHIIRCATASADRVRFRPILAFF
jgi:hypothetical protein